MTLRKSLFVLALLAASLLSVSPAQSAGKPKFKKKINFELVTKVRSPTTVTSAPGYRKLVFVTTRFGVIRVIRDGRLQPGLMLDISDQVKTLWVEQGLLGLAFPPDFRKSGLYYIHYTAKNGDVKVDEYKVNPKDPTRTLEGSRRNVIRIPHVSDAGNHNGGELKFLGHNLFIAIGDGNDPGDKLNLAQDRESLRGKILRIDPRRDEINGRTYRIPATNPFVGQPGRDEIFAYGFRNPHSFDFFRTEKGGLMQMAITDVGQGRMEEINYLPYKFAWGANFGWKMFEGTLPYNCGELLCPNGITPTRSTGIVWPVLTYDHNEGCAVIGGPFVRDRKLTSIDGRLLYGDFCSNRFRTAAPRYGWFTDDRFIGSYMPPGKDKAPTLNGIGEDEAGHVYPFSNFGEIYRLTESNVRITKPVKRTCSKFPNQKKCKKKTSNRDRGSTWNR